MKPKFFYIRNEKQFPVACIAHTEENGIVLFTWAIWNKKDKFDKKRFQEVAGGRLQRVLKENYNIAEYSFDIVGEKTVYGCLPPSGLIEEDIMNMLSSLVRKNGLTPAGEAFVPFSLAKAADKYLRDILSEDIVDILLEKFLAPFDAAVANVSERKPKEECLSTSQSASSNTSNSMQMSSTSQR